MEVIPVQDDTSKLQEEEVKEWRERAGQYITVTIGDACLIMGQLVSIAYKSEEKLDKHLMALWASMLFVSLFMSVILKLYTSYISGQKQLSYGKKNVLTSLASLTTIALMGTNSFLLHIIDKKYTPLTAVGILGCIIVLSFLYLGWNDKHVQQIAENDEYYNSLMKNGFKFAITATSVGLVVQTAITFAYSTNPNFTKNHPHYDLSMSYLATTFGSLAMTITSAPFHFKRELMVDLVKRIRVLVLFILGLVAMIFAKLILDVNMLVLPLVISVVAELIIMLCQTADSDSDLIESEIDPMFITICTVAFMMLTMMYLTMSGIKAYNIYAIYSVFFLFLAIISSLIRLAVPLHETKGEGRSFKIKITESVIYALPGLEMMISLGLFLLEMCKFA